MKKLFIWIKNYLNHPLEIGAVLPTSRFASRLMSSEINKSPDNKIIIDSSDEFLNKNSSVNLAIKGLENTDSKVIYYLNGKKINSNSKLLNSKLGSNTIEAIIKDNSDQITLSK